MKIKASSEGFIWVAMIFILGLITVAFFLMAYLPKLLGK